MTVFIPYKRPSLSLCFTVLLFFNYFAHSSELGSAGSAVQGGQVVEHHSNASITHYGEFSLDVDNDGLSDLLECAYEDYLSSADFKGIFCHIKLANKSELLSVDLPLVSEVLCVYGDFPIMHIRTYYKNANQDLFYRWDQNVPSKGIWHQWEPQRVELDEYFAGLKSTSPCFGVR